MLCPGYAFTDATFQSPLLLGSASNPFADANGNEHVVPGDQTLADYGADVIEVEAPEGDSTRQTGPLTKPGMASLFLGSNRNKRSVVLDLDTSVGRAGPHALTDTADVFIHNIRPQKLAGLGLDAELLCGRNPRLVYAGPHAGNTMVAKPAPTTPMTTLLFGEVAAGILPAGVLNPGSGRTSTISSCRLPA